MYGVVPSVGIPSGSGGTLRKHSVHPCVLSVGLGWGPCSHPGCRDSASVSFAPVLCVCTACICVGFKTSGKDSRPSPGLPSKGPRALSLAALEQGLQSFSQNPSPQGH